MLLEAVSGIGARAYDLWLDYFCMGGDKDEFDIDAYLHGLMQLPATDQNILTQCVWEMYRDLYTPEDNPFLPTSD